MNKIMLFALCNSYTIGNRVFGNRSRLYLLISDHQRGLKTTCLTSCWSRSSQTCQKNLRLGWDLVSLLDKLMQQGLCFLTSILNGVCAVRGTHSVLCCGGAFESQRGSLRCKILLSTEAVFMFVQEMSV